MAIGRHLVIDTMEAAARMGKSVLTERIIYPDSFPTLNPELTAMSTSFAKKISKKVSIFPGAQFLASRTPSAFRVSSKRRDVAGWPVAASGNNGASRAVWRRPGSD